jgi:hypothetical protein
MQEPSPEKAIAISFDTLGYARHLRERGVPQEQAEAMADAARTSIMQELVTREDLRQALDNLDLRLSARVQAQTVRLGVMIGAAVAILATLQKLL